MYVEAHEHFSSLNAVKDPQTIDTVQDHPLLDVVESPPAVNAVEDTPLVGNLETRMIDENPRDSHYDLRLRDNLRRRIVFRDANSVPRRDDVARAVKKEDKVHLWCARAVSGHSSGCRTLASTFALTLQT